MPERVQIARQFQHHRRLRGGAEDHQGRAQSAQRNPGPIHWRGIRTTIIDARRIRPFARPDIPGCA